MDPSGPGPPAYHTYEKPPAYSETPPVYAQGRQNIDDHLAIPDADAITPVVDSSAVHSSAAAVTNNAPTVTEDASGLRRRAPGLLAEVQQDEVPRALRINLLLAKYSVWVLVILGIILLAFGGVAMEDLKDDTKHHECTAHYIDDASDPWDEKPVSEMNPGRYVDDCRLLLVWSYVITIAGVLSFLRALLVCFPGQGIEMVASGILFALYVASAMMLGTSRLITGRPAHDSYKTMYAVCLAVVVLSAAIALHQAAVAALAWLREKRLKRTSVDIAL